MKEGKKEIDEGEGDLTTPWAGAWAHGSRSLIRLYFP